MSATIIIPMVCGYEISMPADRAIFSGRPNHSDCEVFLLNLTWGDNRVDAYWEDVVHVHGQAMRAQGPGGYITYDENNNKVYDMSHPEYRIPRKIKNA